MTAVIPARLTDVVNIVDGERTYPSGGIQKLTVCSVEQWGLRTEYLTPEHPLIESETAWLLAEAGLRLIHHRRRSRHATAGPTLFTAVKVQRDSQSWWTTDLLLGLELPVAGMPRFAGSEQFATAVRGGTLTSLDADIALKIVHRALEELSHCGHNMDSWLTRQGITTPWPPPR